MTASNTILSRRELLQWTIAGATAGVLRVDLRADDTVNADVDPDLIVLLSDPHIAADAKAVSRDVVMTDHLTRVVAAIVALKPRPACVVINGDLALKSGEAGDYAQLAALLAPLAEARIPCVLGLGNHDHRERFRQQKRLHHGLVTSSDAEAWHATWVQLERASLLMLDTLEVTDAVPGRLGEVQLEFLDEMLRQAAARDKPTLVFLHHPATPDDPATTPNLRDHEAFWAVIDQYPHVRAVCYGHLHRWALERRGKVHHISLPATSYVFRVGEPVACVHARLSDDSLQLTLHSLTPHRDHARTVALPLT